MAQFTADEIKPHLNRDAGDAEFDALLEDYIAAAEAGIANWVRRDLDAEYADSGGKWPEPLRQAVRLMVAHFDMNREAATENSMAEIPLGVKVLCAPYKDFAA